MQDEQGESVAIEDDDAAAEKGGDDPTEGVMPLICEHDVSNMAFNIAVSNISQYKVADEILDCISSQPEKALPPARLDCSDLESPTSAEFAADLSDELGENIPCSVPQDFIQEEIQLEVKYASVDSRNDDIQVIVLLSKHVLVTNTVSPSDHDDTNKLT